MERVILHCDLNNFFASVSLLYNQTLLLEPVAVCGDIENRHGIILAKNEIAKSYNVKTAEPVWQARLKCPDLYLLPPLYKEYEKFSEAAKNIYRRYTDRIEPFGIDECWLDVTASRLLFGDGETIANRIRKEIKEELGITASVGVSFNKVFAKLGSDMKKPDAVTVINRENFKQKVWPLPVSDLLFVGKKTAQKLNSMGVFTVGDITLCTSGMLKRALGKNGENLLKYALGRDDSPVSAEINHTPPKSVGRSETYATDFTDEEEVWQAFINFSEEIAHILRKEELYASGVQISLKTIDFKQKELSSKLETPTNIGVILAKEGIKLYRENGGGVFRSVGIRATGLVKNLSSVQLDLFGDILKREKDEIIERKMSELRSRYGGNALRRGCVINSKFSVTGSSPVTLIKKQEQSF